MIKVQVFKNANEQRKTFSAKTMDSIYKQFNRWAQNKGQATIVEGRFLGYLAWEIDGAIYEIRRV